VRNFLPNYIDLTHGLGWLDAHHRACAVEAVVTC
jgi:hypothetical protein